MTGENMNPMVEHPNRYFEKLVPKRSKQLFMMDQIILHTVIPKEEIEYAGANVR